MKTLFLLDASGYIYRSYFAIRNMSNHKGEATGALFGFIRSLQKLFKDFNVDHFACIFDGPRGVEKRKALYTDYKAHREKTPDDLIVQIERAREFCDLMGLPKLVIEGVEADDTMGACALWGKEAGYKVYLATTDKDMAQLVVDEKILLLNTFKENLILGEKGVEETWGVTPSQMIDYLAIVGDASDNVPGVPGIGPKTASSLLKEHGSLENILKLPASLTPKQRTLFIDNQATVILSKELVTIDTKVPIPRDEHFYTKKESDLTGLKAFYQQMGFNSLLKELSEPERKEETGVSYHLVSTESELKALLETLSKETEICFDTETTDVHPLRAELVGVGVGVKEKQAWYIPLNGALEKTLVLELLRGLFENPQIAFYGHNVKYDWHVMRQAGIEVKRISFDTLLASYLLHSHTRAHDLDTLALSHFSKIKIPIYDLIGKGKNQITMKEVPVEKVATYCAEDVDYTIRLKTVLQKELFVRGLDKLYFGLEMPTLISLAHMEENGIFVDIDVLKAQGVEIAKELRHLEKEIWNLAGGEFNLNSPKQVSQILFEKIGLKPLKKTETGYSTSAEVLEELSHHHPIVPKIIEYRVNEKLRSTYIDTLPNQVVKTTGRIHPTFNQSVAATGRLSCQDPNLQNIPVRTEIGAKIREAFRPEKSTASFLAADYSQIELRLVAHLSGDARLIQAFEHDEDIHTYTASLVFGVNIKDVTKEERRRAKAVNFGIIYGQQAFGLSRELGISVEEAKAFIHAYFKEYPGVKDYVEACKESARKTGKAVTIAGREREIPEISGKNPTLRALAERLAINTPLQGSAADLIKIAMIRLDHLLTDDPSLGKMVLQVHDELIFEVQDTKIEELGPKVKKIMEEAMHLKVPLVVDLSIGKNWKLC